MSTTITPTVGRIVWFYPATSQATPGLTAPEAGEPLAAIITRVVDAEGSGVHLTVFDANGVPHQMPYVLIVQGDEERPIAGRYATWMPYQIGQAKKAEGRDQDAKNMASAAHHDYAAQSLRVQVLDMALRTPRLAGHHDVLEAAAAYRAHIEGSPAAAVVETKAYSDGTTFTGTAPLPDHSPTSIGSGLFATSGLTFGTALCALKAGKRVARAGWNGKGMFAYLVPANAYPAQTGAAKAFFGEGGMVPYNAYLALKGADDTVSTWAPSCSDALAEDWLIVE